jgi:hypothetical protein
MSSEGRFYNLSDALGTEDDVNTKIREIFE